MSIDTPASTGGAEARALVAALIELSPYRRGLRPIVAETTRAALVCDQVRAALGRVAQRAGGAAPGRAALGADRALLLGFLEHVYFASPGFLASVGNGRGERAHG
jgi:hypothetical protein